MALRSTQTQDERAEAVALLSLAALRGVGHQTLQHMARSGSYFREMLASEDGSEVLRTIKAAGGKTEAAQFTQPWRLTRQRIADRGEETLARLEHSGVQVLTRASPRYPRSLLDLPDAPWWLFVQGNPEVLSVPSIAVVGTRDPSEDGLWLARFVGLCLDEWRCPTVSGLALGIDQAVHSASVRMSMPTIAVLGTGIFADYPKNAQGLRRDILAGGGAVVTEYLPDETYSSLNFVRRNRLQAALAKALVPVEWREKSGTAHTVRFAASLRRPIAGLSLPGSKGLPYPPDGALYNEFTIPGHEPEFRHYIAEALSRENELRNNDPLSNVQQIQYNLFGG